MTAADYAASLVEPGMIIGLGTGRAATAFVKALGAKVQQGLDIQGVPTSESTAELARLLNIPLLTLSDVPLLDITFDVADEGDVFLDGEKVRFRSTMEARAAGVETVYQNLAVCPAP